MTGPIATVLLDSQGLSLALRGDRRVAVLLGEAGLHDVTVVVSALTVVAAVEGRTDLRRLDWVLSGFRVVGVEPDDGKAAVRLLRAAGGLAGHAQAIDALLAVLALRLPPPVLVVTSDPGDWQRLAADKVQILSV